MCSWSSSAIRPSAVAMPVDTTRPAPRPYVTAVPLKAMLRWSARRASLIVGRAATVFAAGSDSPVRAASLIRSECDSRRRRSAATTSPASSRTRSPGTSWAAGTMATSPSRTTRAVGLVIRLRAAIACSARYSWTNPMTPFSTTIARMTTVSLRSPMTAVTTAAMTSTTIIVLVNCSTSSRHGGLRARSTSSFGPTRESRSAASEAPSPTSGSIPRLATTVSPSSAHGRSSPANGAVGVTRWPSRALP